MSPRTLALMRWSNRPLFAAMHESGCGTNRRLEVGQSMSALPGYLRRQLVPLLPKHHPLRSRDT